MPTIEPDSFILNPAQYIDHACLRAGAVQKDYEQLCEEAVEYGFASVCIPPNIVKFASERLYGSDVGICTVVGFPLGYVTTATKEGETAEAVCSGATEIDMVIPIAHAIAGDFAAVAKDIEAVVRAAEGDSGAIVKVIIECCYLTDTIKRQLVNVISDAGASYIKTSTGFGSSGATLADVQLLVEEARGRIAVKAAGGIRSVDDFLAYIDAGAKRVGLSQSVAIVHQLFATTSQPSPKAE